MFTLIVVKLDLDEIQFLGRYLSGMAQRYGDTRFKGAEKFLRVTHERICFCRVEGTLMFRLKSGVLLSSN